MITYTVHEPPQSPPDRIDRAQSLAFIKDGFSVWAAAFTPFWMMAHKLWLALAIYVAVAVLVEVGLWALGIGQQPAAIILGALHLIVGYEADTIRRWTLDRRGWRMIASVNGRNAEDCERRFFETWLPTQPVIRASALSGSSIVADGMPGPMTRPEAERAKGWGLPRLFGGSR